MQNSESAQVGAVLLLVFQVSLQLGIYRILQTYREEWERAYTFLEERRETHLDAEPKRELLWGEQCLAPPPRIDYGAYTQKAKDAEALCYFLRSDPSLAGASKWQCD